MSSLRSHGRTVVDAPTISSQVSQRNVWRFAALFRTTGGGCCCLSQPPRFTESRLRGCPWKLHPALRVSPLALRSFFDNSIFHFSASDRFFRFPSPGGEVSRSHSGLRSATIVPENNDPSTHACTRGLEHIRNFTVTTTPCW